MNLLAACPERSPGDRTSAAIMRADQRRLWLSSMACVGTPPRGPPAAPCVWGKETSGPVLGIIKSRPYGQPSTWRAGRQPNSRLPARKYAYET